MDDDGRLSGTGLEEPRFLVVEEMGLDLDLGLEEWIVGGADQELVDGADSGKILRREAGEYAFLQIALRIGERDAADASSARDVYDRGTEGQFQFFADVEGSGDSFLSQNFVARLLRPALVGR